LDELVHFVDDVAEGAEVGDIGMISEDGVVCEGRIVRAECEAKSVGFGAKFCVCGWGLRNRQRWGWDRRCGRRRRSCLCSDSASAGSVSLLNGGARNFTDGLEDFSQTVFGSVGVRSDVGEVFKSIRRHVDASYAGGEGCTVVGGTKDW
jgi:hypothetical protein